MWESPVKEVEVGEGTVNKARGEMQQNVPC